jgi:phage-related protein
MTDTFTFVPQTGATGTGTIKLRSAAFGDGYSQESPDGINPVTEVWPLSFNDYLVNLQVIKNFIVAHIGQSFYWTASINTQKYYRCKDYQIVDNGALQGTFTCTLYEFPSP